MADIELNPSIPNNIVELSLRETRQIRRHFERGDVVILRDARIEADYDYFSGIEPPAGTDVRKHKYVFSKAIDGVQEKRDVKWRPFEHGTFAGDPAGFAEFKRRVEGVQAQVNSVANSIFRSVKFRREFITWKFQRVEGENLHIDNLQGCNDYAQFRMFANLDTRQRQWAVGRHWRHYAERYFHIESLQQVADDAFRFNGRLTETAFGSSWQTCEEPRHLVEFAPGEIWLTNSALVAHQVRKGNLLVAGHYEYNYEKCLDRSTGLPAQLRALSGVPYTPTWSERLVRLTDALMGGA